ncbi:Dipeptide ABC transporter, permease protein DppC [Candidatus Syntrophocurvum alkaliphilum]|uniref:Dipeptide ABC transporter, permease protein DppC n=1 Tax=Candidatus Syntrophocurvum alkaliphilum TaxID=2293317 RepID=A0A6I6DCH1_9FIRM|nr:ABC transporter permease [Candidatus Syntrophocurvum alkaliphilum]QGU00365.1 Dipeptide ABC transporter, permease protein DppC [Candidatus Syntrophocurvum alkaliphilum]
MEANVTTQEVKTEEFTKRSLVKETTKQFKKHKLAVISFYIVIFILLMGAFAPIIAPEDPITPQPENRLQAGFWAGNNEQILGTDELGRDIFSRVIYGVQISLKVGFMVITITAVVGTAIGVIAGYFGGVIDLIVMRIIDIFLSFPPLLLALAVVAVLGTGLEKAMLAISIVYIPQMARIVRGSVLTVKELPYINASKVIGAKSSWIITRHVLPNVLPPAIVFLTLLLADAILYTAALGFLGIGIDPSTPEWGAMLSNGRDYLILGYWWVTVFPGLMIMISVLAFNLLGDGLREALDPKMDI